MNIINSYKNQHSIILSLCKSMQNAVETCCNKNDISYFRGIQKTLDDILMKHLQAEDKYLYPSIYKNAESKIHDIAHTFQDEMLKTTTIYTNYTQNYKENNLIEKDIETFVKDTSFMLSSIVARIEKEEKELYSLF